ncbi:3-keto-5-aminohexanoate cleavage protein [Gammaproteobacteria bacterium 42_54_T18]|nr:3-keto-5-aminohexanoate cleavage protein [Gammaproteobacteria bacterium 42_54_T18]
MSKLSSDKVVITCALTGVLTNPQQHPVPVTVEQMAAAAKEAYDAGASIMHVHYRNQTAGMGHLPSWDPDVVAQVDAAIREVCPGVIINMTTGTVTADQSGPIACIRRSKPEIAACNAGSLNYLKATSKGTWAWPPMVFENPVSKIEELLAVMKETNTRPEFECFDIGIVQSVGMYKDVGMFDSDPEYNFVMGVASGMPADPELLPLLVKYKKSASNWQVTAIGRQEIWALHQKTAELGGQLRTGVEDTFYLPSGEKTTGNGQLIDAMVKIAEQAGRVIATPEEARKIVL